MNDILGNPLLKSLKKFKLSFQLALSKYGFKAFYVAAAIATEVVGIEKEPSYIPGSASVIMAMGIALDNEIDKLNPEKIQYQNQLKEEIDNLNKKPIIDIVKPEDEIEEFDEEKEYESEI